MYRAIYLREGRVRGITFTASSAEFATRWAEKWASSARVYLLTVKGVGR